MEAMEEFYEIMVRKDITYPHLYTRVMGEYTVIGELIESNDLSLAIRDVALHVRDQLLEDI